MTIEQGIVPARVVTRTTYGGDEGDHTDARLLSAYTISATFWLLFSTAVGLLLSFKFPFPDLATSPYLSFGRLRPIHTNGTFYGWASIALVGVALYITARSSGTTVRGRPFAWASLWCFNLAAALGSITLGVCRT